MPLPSLPASAKVSALRGVGPVYAAVLEDAGIVTIRDLLWDLPYRYVDRGSVQKIAHLTHRYGSHADREVVTLVGNLRELRQTTTPVQRMSLTEAILDDGTGALRLIWFNQAYLAKALRPGDQILVYGPVVQGKHGLELRGPAWELMGRQTETTDLWVRRYLPLYRRIGPITGSARAKLVQEASSRIEEAGEWLPLNLSEGLPDTLTALRQLHQPDDAMDPMDLESRLTPAHKRLATEELFAFSLGVALRRAERSHRPGIVVPTSPALRERLKSFLPFSLTSAQRRAFREIVADLTSGRVMHRLLQGDVGSGKTLVAFLSMAMVAETDGQATLLVPTEVLARQHAATIERLLGEEKNRLQLLLGAMKAAEKREALTRIASGEARYVVGTHALFQEAVQFASLQLVVVDEQHRFGVRQREAIKAKAQDPHWLVMSATPIPRTLALAVFGDMEQSVLDESPPGRQPIKSQLFGSDDAEGAWCLLERELRNGRQAFVVSPAIDPSDETKVILRDIQAMEALLHARFPDASLAVVHGRLKPEVLAGRMAQFVAGEVQILLATTVIEVGVDIPNATVMVVDHAERFGLSQLHQLRGRVGRGRHRSFFFMISGSDTERLRVVVASQDGFHIAQKDLELRGPGEFFGTRQSGVPRFQVANLARDHALLAACRTYAEKAVAHGLSETQLAWLQQEQARLKLADVS